MSSTKWVVGVLLNYSTASVGYGPDAPQVVLVVVVYCLGAATEYNTATREVCTFQSCCSCSTAVYQRTNVVVTVPLCIQYAVLCTVCKPSVGGFGCATLGYTLWQVKNIVGYLQVLEAVLYCVTSACIFLPDSVFLTHTKIQSHIQFGG